MILYTVVSAEDIFYKQENKKTDKKSFETVCITDPFEYIRNDEYSKACMNIWAYERGKNEYIRSNYSGDNSGTD